MENSKGRLIKAVNLIENKRLILWLNLASLPLLVIFSFLFITIANLFTNKKTALQGDFSFVPFIFFIAAFLGLILIHEGIHGLFFKGFNPKGNVLFGFKNGMAYATSPHSYYTKRTFSWICLAPFTLISIGLTLLYGLGLLQIILYIPLASIHASSCIGDFYFIWLLLKAPKDCLIEDTTQGINFYQKNYQ